MPVVTRETWTGFLSELKIPNYQTIVLKSIERENSTLKKMLDKSNSSQGSYESGISMGMGIIYRLLQMQSQTSLPVVTEEIYKSTVSDLVRRYDFALGLRDKIKEENPVVMGAIYDISSQNSDDPSFSLGFVQGSIMTYELLRRQAEANKLEKEVGSS